MGVRTTLFDERGDGEGVGSVPALSVVGCVGCCSALLDLGFRGLPDEPDCIRASRTLNFLGGDGSAALAFPFPFNMLA